MTVAAMGVHRSARACVLALCIAMLALCSPPEDGSDLAFYVSRPDIRNVKMTVRTYDGRTYQENEVSSGYFFTAPYHRFQQEPRRDDVYDPVQIGPHIYDQSGELIWSGAQLTNNGVATAFRVTPLDGVDHLTFILQERITNVKRETAFVLDANYDVVKTVDLSRSFDAHEFVALNNATSFLRILNEKIPTVNAIPDETITVTDSCASEIDEQGNDIFRFCPVGRLDLDETRFQMPNEYILRTEGWDLFHMNSVDKFENGDYLTSIRYTCAIYKVSGISGEVLWRLGGKRSDFTMDFDFLGQHDARVISSNDTVTIISFFDNASTGNMGGFEHNEDSSSFKVVALHEQESPMRAELLKQYNRPDGDYTHLRGNGQYYPNGGAFVCWSIQSYSTEFGPSGEILQEAIFNSDRFDTYRMYKFDFVGTPSSPPDLRTLAAPDGKGKMLSTSYVSWNGATEVATWEFFGSDDEEGGYRSLGTVARTGFETVFAAHRAWNYTWVQARDRNGTVLGGSQKMKTELPASVSFGSYEQKASSALESMKTSAITILADLSETTTMLLIVIVAGFSGVGIAVVTLHLWRHVKRLMDEDDPHYTKGMAHVYRPVDQNSLDHDEDVRRLACQED